LQISYGDIFKGAPAADAIVSPANSFGFMDGGIDYAYSDHFGWHIGEVLRAELKKNWGGELPVGSAVIVPMYDDLSKVECDPNHNGGKPIPYLISAPTMRVPEDVSNTVNSYLAFRAILRSVMKFNEDALQSGSQLIRHVLCPGLGTAVGRMPYQRAAVQMRSAYNSVMLGKEEVLLDPPGLYDVMRHQQTVLMSGSESETTLGKEAEPGELFVSAKKKSQGQMSH
jgi:O-acetyl-ADP-ribose deacetylase (regulator of RNase III)